MCIFALVWRQSDGTFARVYANRYDIETQTWLDAEEISTSDANAYSPKIVIDFCGNIIAVWRQEDGVISKMVANHYDAISNSWGGAEVISSSDYDVHSLVDLAVDSDGNAYAIWGDTPNGIDYYIALHRYE
ncbi:MAG: hypothetical protein ABFS43_07415 [Thermodesulfobacteriota bacterium]